MIDSNVDTPQFKTCTKCGIYKPLHEFHRKKELKDGYRNTCKMCRSEAEGFRYRKTPVSGYKICAKCNGEFPATSDCFWKCGDSKDGFRYTCIKCDKETREQRTEEQKAKDSASKRRYAETHIDQTREAGRRHYHANKHQYHLYYLEHKDQHQESGRRWVIEHREHVRMSARERGRARRNSNPGRDAVIVQRRLARKRSLPDTLTNADWQRCLSYFNGCCAVCGKPPGLWHTLAMDHWTALSSPDCPGTVPTNIVPLCHGIDGCNNSKSNKPAEQWLIQKFGEKKARKILKRIHDYFDSLK